MVYEAKLLAMLAFGLKLKGCHIKVLMSRVFVAKRYFKTFELVILYIGKILNRRRKKIGCDAEAHKFLSGD